MLNSEDTISIKNPWEYKR